MKFGINGVNKNIKSGLIGIGGINKNLKEVYVGIGGVNKLVWSAFVAVARLYHCDYSSDKNYELNIDTLATINTVSSPSSSSPHGIGGIKT